MKRYIAAPRRIALGKAVLLSLFLAGCAGGSGISTDRSDKFVYASLGAVNHTGNYMDWVSIDGVPSHNMRAYGSANAGTCCVGVPRIYRPGLQVTVKWKARDGAKILYGSKVVEVEPYAEAGTIYAHIYPNDVVRVVVSARYDAHSPNHPIPYPVDPNKSKEFQQ
ncbi:DUF3304 domain-containing protein [Cupriavidus sp. 2MCAB6]|uniref:DUF3304 domain-containing protein n=1 Tax=Cupriavidus sp. 2MCAB6 TaxID=3232981 RepID=UPI003F936B68